MSDLFMRRSAVISDCKDYRPELRRIWDDRLPLLVVCMLNPSRADDLKEDPTLLTLIHFARFWGYGGLLVVNLYSFRSSSPKEMFAVGERAIGPENEFYIAAAVEYARAFGGRLLAAWGNDGGDRGRQVASYIESCGVSMICLGTTQSGAPKHPMARGQHRIPRDQVPIEWKEPSFA